MSDPIGVEDIIEAPLETVRQAAEQVLGSDPKEERLKDGSIIFTKNVTQCPPQIKLYPVDKTKFRVVTTSKCNIKDCDYWQRCAELDSENMRELKEEVAELQGKAVARGEKRWTVREGKSSRVVDDALRR